MLVEELIAQLQKYDPKLQVIGSGYEGGYDDLEAAVQIKIALDVNEAWYYGPHELATDYKVTDSTKQYCIVDAVFIG